MQRAVTPDELEAAHVVQAQVVEFTADDSDPEDKMRDQLASAADLMKRTAILLDFAADPMLMEKVTKRERTIFAKTATYLWRHAQASEALVEKFDLGEDDDTEEMESE